MNEPDPTTTSFHNVSEAVREVAELRADLRLARAEIVRLKAERAALMGELRQLRDVATRALSALEASL